MDLLRRTALLSLAALVGLSPLATAHDGCDDHPILVDHYLKTGPDGKLGLSHLPPSAASATTWTVDVKTGESKAIVISFPTPAFEVDEAIDIAGKIRVESHLLYAGPLPFNLGYDYPEVQVDLVEGERSVRLAAGYAQGERDLKGSYPGHGAGGAPHTHGDGSDASRGLYTSDLQVRLTFKVRPSAFSEPINHRTWEIAVHVDGTSFLRLAKAGDVPVAEPVAKPAPTPPEPAPEEPKEEPQAENGTGPEGQPPASSPQEDDEQRTLSTFVTSAGAPAGAVLAAALAGMGGALVARRGRRSP